MKIRHGFVSNSSSSSFCMLGVQTDMYTDFYEYDEDILAIDGYNLGMCIGYDPSPYLEKYKLPEACEQVKQRLKEKLPKEIYEHIKNDKVDLLWDIYED